MEEYKYTDLFDLEGHYVKVDVDGWVGMGLLEKFDYDTRELIFEDGETLYVPAGVTVEAEFLEAHYGMRAA